MTTDIISSPVQQTSSKSQSQGISYKLYADRLQKIANNFFHLLRSLEYLSIRLEDKTVVISHESGTTVAFREDGNIDVLSERNMIQRTKGLMHLNPATLEDDKYTSYEDLVRAYPERFNQSQ